MSLRELGLHLTTRQHKLVKKIMIKFDLNLDLMTYSSGRSLIFLSQNKVYQIYLTDKLFEKVVYNIELCKKVEGIIIQYNIYPNLNTIEYEYIEPIYNIINNTINVNESFYFDIYQILNSFLKHRIVHGDFCCDNIGYSSKQKRYIIYDLETVRPMNAGDEDIDRNRFEKSVKFCTN